MENNMTLNQLRILKKYRDNKRINLELKSLELIVDAKEQKLMTLCIQQQMLGADYEITDHASLQIAEVNLVCLGKIEEDILVLQGELKKLNLKKTDKEKSLIVLENVIDKIDNLISIDEKIERSNIIKVKDKQVQSWLCDNLARRLYD
ncbi:hypothetical protein [Shewanella woodyi]|uniref:hypothetical protein n=1 Tax=Shewanella woodyi TaxID=60961 RepID=UPI003749F7FF